MLISKGLVKILKVLNTCETLNVNDIVKILKMSQPLVSRRLKILKNLGLVKSKKAGNYAFYKLSEKYKNNIIKYLITIYEELYS